MANFLKRLFDKEKWDSFLYYDDDEDTYDDIADEYYEEQVPMYTMEEPDIDFVDVNTGEKINYIPVQKEDTVSIKYRLCEKKFTREQRVILSALQSEMDYEFVMNGYITQEKIHEIFGLDTRPVVEKEEEEMPCVTEITE